MNLSLKIAWRNIWRHKGKSIIIGVILLFGALLMTMGNGMIAGMQHGMSQNIVNSFTGDVVLISDQEEKDDVIFAATGKPLKVLKNFSEVDKVLKKEPVIDKYIPVTAGMVYVFNSTSDMGYVFLLGVDIERYREMFPDNFKITEGRLFKPGERGLLVSEEARKQAYDTMDFWAIPQNVELDKNKLPADARKSVDTLDLRRDFVFMGASTSNTTVDVRVPVTGIMKYRALNKVWGNYCIVDIESFREAHNYVTGADQAVEVSTDKKELLESDELDQLFSSDSLVEDTKISDEVFSVEALQKETERSAVAYNPNTGSYNMAFIKLKDGVKVNDALAQMNKAFKDKGLEVRAISWEKAIGTYGSMAALVKVALNVFIMFIFFVAIIVIMNTLSMAAMERVAEIGMMRAIGARKSFVRKMFVLETGFLSFFFGGLGILIGVIVIYALKAAGITTTNEVLQLVYGGDILNPIFSLNDLILGIVELSVVTLLAVLYPLTVVGKILPLDAITRD